LVVDEREAKTVFQVEYTDYGWAVSIGGQRSGCVPVAGRSARLRTGTARGTAREG
jgi:hypothetical protein